MKKQIVHAPGVPVSDLPFSPAVISGGFVFVSGQASVDGQGKIVSGDFADEMRRSFENVARVLAGAGLDLTDVIQVRSYVRDEADLPTYNTIYREIFADPYPARTTITNCLPKSLKFEVEVVAQLRE